MLKKFCLSFFLLSTYTAWDAYQTYGLNMPLINTASDLDKAINQNTGKMVCIISYLPGLVACIKMVRTYAKSANFHLNDRIKFYRIFTLNPTATQAIFNHYSKNEPAGHYLKTSSVPTIKIFFNGKYVSSIDGFLPYARMEEELKKMYQKLFNLYI